MGSETEKPQGGAGLTLPLQLGLPCIEDAQEVPRACFKEELLPNILDAFVLT